MSNGLAKCAQCCLVKYKTDYFLQSAECWLKCWQYTIMCVWFQHRCQIVTLL